MKKHASAKILNNSISPHEIIMIRGCILRSDSIYVHKSFECQARDIVVSRTDSIIDVNHFRDISKTGKIHFSTGNKNGWFLSLQDEWSQRD